MKTNETLFRLLSMTNAEERFLYEVEQPAT